MICRHCGQSQNLSKDERSAAVKKGLRKARKNGATLGRPKFDRDRIVSMRKKHSIRNIARLLKISIGTVNNAIREQQ